MPDDSYRQLSAFKLTKEQVQNDVRFYFIPISGSYLYFFSLSADREFRLIFPVSFHDFSKVDYHYRRYEFPENSIWPFMNTVCSETHVLVSTKRLKEFERLITDYRKSGPAGKPAVFSDIMMYISHLRSLKYLSGTAVSPWENSSHPSRESGEKMSIEVTAVKFNRYFEAIFEYECE